MNTLTIAAISLVIGIILSVIFVRVMVKILTPKKNYVLSSPLPRGGLKRSKIRGPKYR